MLSINLSVCQLGSDIGTKKGVPTSSGLLPKRIKPKNLTLWRLCCFAGFLQAGLLAFLDTGIAREQAVLTEHRLEFLVG